MKQFLTLAIATAVAASANANLIVNGSFEDVSLPSRNYDFFTSVSGWTAEQDKIEIGKASVYGVTGQDQQNVLELDARSGNAKVSQTISGMAAGQYYVSFLSARRKNRTSEDTKIEVLWNDMLVATIEPTSTVMSSNLYTVTAMAGDNKLSFRGAGSSTTYGGLVDDVRVEAVPEPATMAALGLGALTLIRRRKSA